MARARENFFADFPDADEIKARAEEAAEPDLGHTRVVSKDDLMADIDSTKEISRQDLHPETAEPAPAADPREMEFKDQMSEIDDLLSQFASISGSTAPAQPEVTEAPAVPEAPEVLEVPEEPAVPEVPAQPEIIEEEPVFEPPTESVFETAADIPYEAPQADASMAQALAALEEEAAQAQAAAEELPQAPAEEVQAAAEELPQAEEILQEEVLQTEAAQAEALAQEALSEEKPGLEDTMVVPMSRQEVNEALTEEVPAEEENLSPKEQKKRDKERAREMKRQAKENKKARKAAEVEDTFGEEEYEDEAPAKGGVGRTILMIILIILCIIFALELAGIGIKLLAPTSDAAAFIDNILNSLIHMITGSNGGMA